MFDVIAIGSATRDIFLDAGKFKKGENLCFPLGGKFELENLMRFSGGGGVNCATTFALQGLNTAFCGIVGQDTAGQDIIDELNQKGIDTEMVKVKLKARTDLGLIFHAGAERTILLHHSSSKALSEKDIDWEKLAETKWLYLAPLWGEAAKLTEKLVDFTRKNNIKIALNPSLNQLALKNINGILKNIDVLILNDDEASRIHLKSDFKMIIVTTKGKEGASVFNGKTLYQMPAPKVKVIDATGAGDSFGSGFIAGLMQTKNIEKAMQLGMANAIANIQTLGANNGLLKKGEKITPVLVKNHDQSKQDN